jgi:uncharacterized protein
MDGSLHSMAPHDTTAPPEVLEGQRVALRGVPWLWKDLLVGFVPLIAMRVAAAWVDVAGLPSMVRWLVLLLVLLSMAWMLGYPLWIARRRHARLPRISIRAVAIEAALAIPALLVIWVALAAVLAAWTLLAGGPPPRNPLEPAAREGNWAFAAVFTLFAAIVAPVTEEVFFRGMVYNGLRQRLHPLLAAILQAAAFGLLHTFGYVHAALAALSGLALAAVYEWRGTLLAPIFVHALQNLVVGLIAVSAAISSANAPVLGIMGHAQDGGCLITEVHPESGGHEAGLRPGDRLTSVDEEPVADIHEVADVVRRKRVGDRVWVEFVRDGEIHRVEAILKLRPK